MNRCSSWVLVLALAIIGQRAAQNITKADNIEARTFVIYALSTTSIPSGTYIVLFLKMNMGSTPQVTFGLNNYNIGDAFYTQEFYAQSLTRSAQSFSLVLVSGSNTNVKMYSISYISIWNDAAFSTAFLSFTPGTNLTSGSGDRFFALYQTANFSSIAVVPIPLIAGFKLNSNTQFAILVDVKIVSELNYLLNISTKSDCRVNLMVINILFYFPSQLTAKKYYFIGDTAGYGSLNQTNVLTYNRSLDNFQTTEFILGLSGFHGLTPSSGNLKFGWASELVNSTTKGLVTFQFNQFQRLYYSFFQIGRIASQSSVVVEQKTSFLPIIIGLVMGIVLLSITIGIIVKKCKANEIYPLALKDDLRSLPSLSLT